MKSISHSSRSAAAAAWLAAGFCSFEPALAQSAAETVYRCPGPSSALYTNGISPQQAKDRGCKAIESAPLTVVQGRRPVAAAAPAAGSSPRGAEGRIEASEQRNRDNEARRILETELNREQERLAALQKDFNNGEPERRGDERNYVKYAERIAEMKAGIERKQGDVDAIRRELSKLPPS